MYSGDANESEGEGWCLWDFSDGHAVSLLSLLGSSPYIVLTTSFNRSLVFGIIRLGFVAKTFSGTIIDYIA